LGDRPVDRRRGGKTDLDAPFQNLTPSSLGHGLGVVTRSAIRERFNAGPLALLAATGN